MIGHVTAYWVLNVCLCGGTCCYDEENVAADPNASPHCLDDMQVDGTLECDAPAVARGLDNVIDAMPPATHTHKNVIEQNLITGGHFGVLQISYTLGLLLVTFAAFIGLRLCFSGGVREHTDICEQDASKRGVSVQEMWDYSRMKPEAGVFDFMVLSLWAPFGFVLAMLRLAALLVLPFLHNIFNNMGQGAAFACVWCPFMLGMWVKTQGRANLQSTSARIMVCNHVSDFDGAILASIAGLSKTEFVANEHTRPFTASLQRLGFPLNMIWVKDGKAKEVIRSATHGKLSEASRMIVIWPEGRCTSGRGVLRFRPFVFTLDQDIRILPCTIQIYNPLPVRINFMGSKLLSNIFWLYFLPVTVFNVTFLPQAKREDGESGEEFASRIQQQIATDLAVPATQFSEAEWRKARIAQGLPVPVETQPR